MDTPALSWPTAWLGDDWFRTRRMHAHSNLRRAHSKMVDVRRPSQMLGIVDATPPPLPPPFRAQMLGIV